MRSFIRNFCPAGAPRCTFGAFAACTDTSAICSKSQFSSAIMQVNILVVLALASASDPFLLYKIRPEPPSIKTAAFAKSSASSGGSCAAINFVGYVNRMIRHMINEIALFKPRTHFFSSLIYMQK